MTSEQQKQSAYPNHNDVDACRDDNVDGGQCETKIAYLSPRTRQADDGDVDTFCDDNV